MIPKVLLVEDDGDIRNLFRMGLDDAGFEVKEAVDGLEAIAMVQQEEFDAIVLDLSMPRIDGVAALDTFKIMRNGQRVPIIAVTALDDPAVRQRALEAGAADYLHKPVTPQQVADTVRKHLRVPSEV